MSTTIKLTREQWLAEVRRLYVEKYKVEWSADAVAQYAEALAASYYDDPDWQEEPDAAIQDDFSYAL